MSLEDELVAQVQEMVLDKPPEPVVAVEQPLAAVDAQQVQAVDEAFVDYRESEQVRQLLGLYLGLNLLHGLVPDGTAGSPSQAAGKEKEEGEEKPKSNP